MCMCVKNKVIYENWSLFFRYNAIENLTKIYRNALCAYLLKNKMIYEKWSLFLPYKAGENLTKTRFCSCLTKQ